MFCFFIHNRTTNKIIQGSNQQKVGDLDMAYCKYLQKNWVSQVVQALQLINPDMTHSELVSFAEKEFRKHYTDHKAVIFNSYENITFHTTLGETVDWIQSFRPLIAESGVFFYPKDQKRNLNIEIIKECMLDARTIHKAEKFAALDAGDVFLASTKDIQQANDKKAANSGYGAEGQRSSFLFNMHSAMSVTSCGRGQLSTASQCIENLMADYVKFFNMDEFFTYINHIANEKHEWKFDVNQVVDEVPNEDQYTKRFLGKFLHVTFADEDKIRKVYQNLSDELRIRTYYKANLLEFLSNFMPRRILTEIMSMKCKFKKLNKDGTEKPHYFIDPNDVPDSIQEPLDLLTSMVMEFVLYKYGVFRYEDRMRYQKRYGIPVSDTDSVFIGYQNQCEYIEQNILPKSLKRKDDKGKHEEKMQHIKLINILSYITSAGIKGTLWHYLSKVHVAEADRGYIKMKNEFYYSRLIVTHAKKSYVGLMQRQESHVYDKPKLDVKGVNFFKSTASERTSDFIYQEILMNQLLQPKDGKISLQRTYKTIHDFQMDIAKDIKKGDMGFLKRSIKVKTPDAYANPMSIGAYKAVWIWNYIVGEDSPNRISLPATTTQVKVILRNKQDAAKLEQWPDIYEKVIDLFENNPEVGDVYDPTTGKIKKGKGIKTIALPDDMDEVPDWILEVIDVDTLVNDNMALFTQIMRPLGLQKGTTTHNGSNLAYYTNIVRI